VGWGGGEDRGSRLRTGEILRQGGISGMNDERKAAGGRGEGLCEKAKKGTISICRRRGGQYSKGWEGKKRDASLTSSNKMRRVQPFARGSGDRKQTVNGAEWRRGDAGRLLVFTHRRTTGGKAAELAAEKGSHFSSF